MQYEVWLVGSTPVLNTSFKNHIKQVTGVHIVHLTPQTVQSRIVEIQKTHSPGEAPILVLLNIHVPAKFVESLIQWRKQLWPLPKHPRSPMVAFYVFSEGRVQDARQKWTDFKQTYPDDYHFCSVEQLRADLFTFIKRAQLRRLHAEWGMVMAPRSPLEKTKSLIDTLAAYDTTVLITGESGTGKELVARALHFRGKRAKKPFIAKNCREFPANLFESELFGTKRGAATDAVDRAGYLELANQGTFFFDEIGELSPSDQIKLLRVLQEKQVQRLGSTTLQDIDVRFIAATNQPLEDRVRQGAFREDLFYRLNVARIHLPPLRERGPADLQALIDYFLMDHAQQNGRLPKELDDQAVQVLLDYHWPGNVRELSNVLERAMILCDHRQDSKIQAIDIQFDMLSPLGPQPSGNALPGTSQDAGKLSRLNPYSRKTLTIDHREAIKLAVIWSKGRLTRAATLLQQAGYKKGASRGRLRNLFGLTNTEEAFDPELTSWYQQTYPDKVP